MGKDNRDRIVKVCMTATEAERLRASASAAGVSMSSYMRSRCLARGDVGPVPVVDVRELRTVYQELRRCGNNLNQITRAINSFGSDAVPARAVESALGSVGSASDAVADVLSRARR